MAKIYEVMIKIYIKFKNKLDKNMQSNLEKRMTFKLLQSEREERSLQQI